MWKIARGIKRERECREQGEGEGDYPPEEKAKGGRGAPDAAGGDDGERDGAGEPEDGGDAGEGEGDEAVEQRRGVGRRQGQVRQHQQRPDRVEDHEVHPRRRVVPDAAPAEPAGNCLFLRR